MRAAVGRDHAKQVQVPVEEYHLARRLHDLARRTHAGNALRLAVERRVEDALLVGEVLHLLEQFWLVLGFVRRRGAAFDLPSIQTLEDIAAFGIHTLERQQPSDGLTRFGCGWRRGDTPDAAEGEFAVRRVRRGRRGLRRHEGTREKQGGCRSEETVAHTSLLLLRRVVAKPELDAVAVGE